MMILLAGRLYFENSPSLCVMVTNTNESWDTGWLILIEKETNVLGELCKELRTEKSLEEQGKVVL